MPSGKAAGEGRGSFEKVEGERKETSEETEEKSPQVFWSAACFALFRDAISILLHIIASPSLRGLGDIPFSDGEQRFVVACSSYLRGLHVRSPRLSFSCFIVYNLT